jgi:hypothetical protein
MYLAEQLGEVDFERASVDVLRDDAELEVRVGDRTRVATHHAIQEVNEPIA